MATPENAKVERELTPNRLIRRLRVFGVRSLGASPRRLQEEDRERILAELFISDNVDLAPYVWRFCVLLGLSASIAAFGLLANSTAVVIGAMLIAPLMEPILAAAAALVMGWHGKLLRCLILITTGVAMVFAVSFLFSMITPDVPFTSNEVLARTEPTLFDLGVAAAAGAAAVFTMIYRIQAAVPGVAIAVSLVPPLASAGIAAEQGLHDQAIGAMLLFVTNLSAILLVGALMLAVHGFSQAASIRRGGVRLWHTVGISLAAVIVIAVPLAEQTGEVFDEVRMEGLAYSMLANLGQGGQHMNYKVEAEGDTLRLYLAGAEFPVGIEEMADKLSQIKGEPVTVQAQWFEVKESITRGSPN